MALLKFKRSAVPSKAPALGDLELGELAINTYDGKVYMKKDNGSASIVEVGGSGGGGTVTSVAGTGTVNGITLSGTVTSSGSLTLGGTLSGVSLTSQVSGILPIANGGTGNANGTAVKWTTARTLSFTGDATGSMSVDGSADASASLTLANSGVTAGTYTKVTVDGKGRVTTGASLASGDLPTYTGSLTSSQVTTALGYTPSQGFQSTGQQVVASSTALTSSGNSGSNILVVTSGITVTLPTSAISGKTITISNISGGNITLSYAGSAGTDGPTTMAGGTSLMLISDGGSPPFWRLTVPFGAFDGGTLFEAGYKILPQNQRTGAYTLALSDAGKHLYVTAGAFATTIPADATLNFPVGTAITFVCEDAGKTIVPASGVALVLAGTGAATTGTRTLAIGAVATLIKVQANRWYISGSGVT